MDRADLERRAEGEFIQRITRDDIQQILKMLDANNIERDDSRETRAYELAAEVRSDVLLLKTRIDALASYLDNK